MKSTRRRLAIASSLMAFALLATPAMAICKYGGPHCPNLHALPKAPTVNSNRLPDGPPGNDDCKYYGNCDDGSPEGTGVDGNPNGGLGNGTSPAVIIGHHHPVKPILPPLIKLHHH